MIVTCALVSTVTCCLPMSIEILTERRKEKIISISTRKHFHIKRLYQIYHETQTYFALSQRHSLVKNDEGKTNLKFTRGGIFLFLSLSDLLCPPSLSIAGIYVTVCGDSEPVSSVGQAPVTGSPWGYLEHIIQQWVTVTGSPLRGKHAGELNLFLTCI